MVTTVRSGLMYVTVAPGTLKTASSGREKLLNLNAKMKPSWHWLDKDCVSNLTRISAPPVQLVTSRAPLGWMFGSGLGCYAFFCNF